ncbi:hypothetical protein L6164_021348 [Bauhinia variegata]|uniref:Uncharacterized protein n=1 Tax=Bauhinia variegata TaxID=167791 RepID=A0ACB9MZJ4_BAUVA|nr:hypothetical protein L6164_021348 [Bauhinia variegata]
MEGSQTMISAISSSSSSFPLIAILLVIPVLLVLKYNQKNWRNAPPGPVGWPILGFLPRISSRLHHDFFELAKEYGPLMSLKMGVKPAIVVSSPEMAYQVLKVLDNVVSSRTITEAVQIAAYDASSVAFSPYGPSWLVLRKIIMSELLSPTSLKSFESLRKQQVHGLLRELYKVSLLKGSIDIADSAFWALANQISTLVVSECLFDSTEKGSQVKDKFVNVMATFGTPNISDLIPVFKPFDPQGIRRKLVQLFSGLDAFYDELVDKRLAAKQMGTTTKNGKRDLLDVLLEYRSDKKEYGYEKLPRKVIKGMLGDMFMAGTVTSSSTIEWEKALKDSSEIGVIALKKAISLVGTAKPRLADSLYHK